MPMCMVLHEVPKFLDPSQGDPKKGRHNSSTVYAWLMKALSFVMWSMKYALITPCHMAET
jgi:hypothetical protein